MKDFVNVKTISWLASSGGKQQQQQQQQQHNSSSSTTAAQQQHNSATYVRAADMSSAMCQNQQCKRRYLAVLEAMLADNR
jgi:hypothetical protein